MRPRIRIVSGLRYSEHGLSRGNRARSSSNTSAPARASSSAVADPAGPAPTTTASSRLTRRSVEQSPADRDRRPGERRRQIHAVVVQPSPALDEHDRLVTHRSTAFCPAGAGGALEYALRGRTEK